MVIHLLKHLVGSGSEASIHYLSMIFGVFGDSSFAVIVV